MSVRNFKLLIILITIILLVVLVSLLSKKPTETGEEIDTKKGTNFFTDFLPFGKNKTNNNNNEVNPTDISNNGDVYNTAELKKMVLKKVSSMPITGFGVFQKERFVDIPVVIPSTNQNTETVLPPESTYVAPPTEFVSMIRYADKGTGTIFQTLADEINEKKISNQIIPNVYDTYFGNMGSSIIMRYLKIGSDTITSYMGSLPEDTLGGDTSTAPVTGSFLPENVLDLSISPDTKKSFYLSKSANGVVGVYSELSGGQKIQIFNSPYTEWLSSWPNENMITLTTKASGYSPGYMYAIDPSKKDWRRILGNINGLTTLTSPNGKLVLFSDNNLSLNVYNIETKGFKTLKIKTLPEKCVWSKDNANIYCFVPNVLVRSLYPDSWYQGEVSFSDKIWKVNLDTLLERIILDPVLVKQSDNFDGIKPTLDENENYLFFMNKKDSYLWELKLK